ncbi:MAG: hypothetical protein D3924_08450 [Candidatus Electrothrix sp. AR4]|nr:hypothetical protein [Candidatus Electrothrix sp. AR4]
MKAKTVVGMIIVAVIAGSVFYFVSAPFKTKVDMKVEQATKWTPENIQKDPAGYLVWASEKAQSAINSIEARRIALSQQKSKNESLIIDKSQEKTAAHRLFLKFRDAYKAAEADGSWPADIDGSLYNRVQLKNQIVQMKNRLDSTTQQSEQLARLHEKLLSQMNLLDQKLSETSSTKTDLEHKLEVVKANKTISDQQNLQTDIASLSGVADFLAQSETLPTVDTLINREKAHVTDEEFTQILNAEME